MNSFWSVHPPPQWMNPRKLAVLIPKESQRQRPILLLLKSCYYAKALLQDQIKYQTLWQSCNHFLELRASCKSFLEMLQEFHTKSHSLLSYHLYKKPSSALKHGNHILLYALIILSTVLPEPFIQ